ncbi:hypothetical protein QYE76_033762 [Lolium multiflorum]|uniref:F-box domain-containing protein n=1 Tax=Lolium multiflorum TaxID=4521 RepID=A0AAD8QY77_LOLMU|nr:hypothetical protein QYE76_033762 [Lolium multiflorum]
MGVASSSSQRRNRPGHRRRHTLSRPLHQLASPVRPPVSASSSGAATMDPPCKQDEEESAPSSLPEELIEDIFARMPAKSAQRCRCLSRAWAATLSSDQYRTIPPPFPSHLTWMISSLLKSWYSLAQTIHHGLGHEVGNAEVQWMSSSCGLLQSSSHHTEDVLPAKHHLHILHGHAQVTHNVCKMSKVINYLLLPVQLRDTMNLCPNV